MCLVLEFAEGEVSGGVNNYSVRARGTGRCLSIESFVVLHRLMIRHCDESRKRPHPQ